MPDIRDFFTNKGGATTSQQKLKAASTPAAKRKAPSRKRRVVDSDSDEEEEEELVPAKKPTPKKAATRTTKKEVEKEPEETTTTSSYFSTNGKNKVTRSASIKAATVKAAPVKAVPVKAAPVKPAPAKKVVQAKPKSASKAPTHFIDDDDEDYGNDIHAAEYKKEDDYVEEPEDDTDMDDDFVVPDDEDEDEDEDMVVDEDEDEDVKPQKSARGKVAAMAAKKRKSVPWDDDDDEEEEEAPKRVTRGKVATTAGKKRKSVPWDDDEEEEEEVMPKKPPVKRARAPAKPKEVPEESEEIKKIFDSVPTVRPPTPTVQLTKEGEPKKFNYREFKARSNIAPPAAGSKEVPVGEENCLTGLTFVFTGVLESLSREDGQQLVKRYGGRVTTAPSRKTSYVVLGNDAGPSKLKTIRANGLKTINEDGLFHLIRTLPANGGGSAAAQVNEAKKAAEQEKIEEMAKQMDEEAKAKAQAKAQLNASKGKAAPPRENCDLWTVKYAPNALNQICGNKGQVEKLQRWLRNWHHNAKIGFRKKGDDGMSGCRAVMIYGPPGIGKTTAAHLIAKLEGFDIVESNASDTRSKKLMEESLRGVLDNRSLMGYFAPGKEKVEVGKQKLVLIMDEVDGMSAGDRGGVGQLAATCRKTNIPIICICNDRKLQKMKTFDSVTYDLPFRRPDANAIRSRVMSIAFREGLKLPPNVIDQLVQGTHADIRQIINMLSTYSTTQTSMNFDQSKDLAKSWEKHIILKPWDIATKLLGQELFGPNSKKTLNDKVELYFNDHELSYLMLQENYLKTTPARANNYTGREKVLKMLELADMAAEAISDGDLVDAMIHGPQQHWSLMPVHGMFSTVKPASCMYGSFMSYSGNGAMSFTTWLGNNSKQTKLTRYVKEIQSHLRLRASGDRHEVRQNYIPVLHRLLVGRLEREGKEAIPEVIDTMDSYFLTREDWDAIVELGVGPMADGTFNIATQVKTAFTKQYNQASHPLPFMKASNTFASKASGKREVPDNEEAIIESEDEAPDDTEAKVEDDEDLSKDKYVKQPKKKAAPKGKAGATPKTAAPKAAASASKGKGRGRK
ncbi:DNA replication factor C complex subunit Rfc1 [Rhizina undulata]